MYKIKFLLNKYNHFVLLFLVLIVSFQSIKFFQEYKIRELSGFEKLLNNIYFEKTLIATFDELNPRYETINYEVKIGDNFNKILNIINLPSSEKDKILKTINKNKKISKLEEGQKIKFKIDYKNPIKIVEIELTKDKTKHIKFVRNIENNTFSVKEVEKKLVKKIEYRESKITNSLYSSAIKEGISPNVIINFARIYGFQIDFQRDIWKNDIFQIVYENYLNEKNQIADTGKILYANLILQGKEYPLYFFESKNSSDHYDENGQSIRKTLMKTPINGARLSSSFGLRKHPILGFNKMHRGTDFAAPKGTPIMASGDGMVIKAGWCGGGGNCVKIKHNSTYSTVYAHMSKFGRGIKKGARVNQGQTIGYVGSTGMSTGPHLHYEVIENGRKINSQTLKLPSGKVLKGKERKLFEIVKIKTDVLKSELINYLN